MLNQLKTVLLLGALTGILLAIGAVFGGQGGLIIALVLAVAMNFGAYWFSDKMVLRMYKAQEVTDEHSRLYQMVKEVAEKAGVPMPKVYTIPSDQPNAFATGRNPSHAAVAATEGIMKLLDENELKGVIAHEIAHVKNRDILIATIAATIAGVISYLAFFAQFAAMFGGMGRDRGGGSIIQLLAIAIITPIMAVIIQLAISRSREFLADETGAKMIRDSESLARALEKLDRTSKHVPMRMGSQATASLFIVNPFIGKSMMKFLSTHPPMEKRVAKLRSLNF